ncbi:MAG TPA: VanZ family protein, partial [Polyangia bacterium]
QVEDVRAGLVSRWLPVVLFAALIFVGSSIPGNAINPRLTIHDKVVHAGEYAVFALLLARAIGARWWWLAIVAGALYGVSDEFHQTFTPMRSGNDLGDMTADLVGSAIGAVSWRLLLRRRRVDGTKSA